MIFQDTIKLAPQEKGAAEISGLVSEIIRNSNIKAGICLWEKTTQPKQRKRTTIIGE